MSEMIDRVAKAIRDGIAPFVESMPADSDIREAARTAIEAMRPRDADTLPRGAHLGMPPRQFINCWIDGAFR